MRRTRAVLQDHAHRGAVGAGALEPAFVERTLERQHLGGRLGEVDVHRVDLLDQRERRRLALPDQRALGHQRAADAPGDRRDDKGIAQVDLRRPAPRPGRRPRRLSACFSAATALVYSLLADGVGLHQRLVALDQGAGRSQVGLGARELGPRAAQRGFVVQDAGSMRYSTWPARTSLPSRNTRCSTMPAARAHLRRA